MKKFKLFKSGFCEKLKLLLIPIGLLIGNFTMPAWADEAGVFYSYFKYELDGEEHTISREYANTDNATTDVGTVTSSLKFKAIYIKVWNNTGGKGNICGGHMAYTLNNWTNTEYYATDTWSDWNVDGVANRRQISKTMETSIASSTDASGKYSIPYYWKVWGDKNGTDCDDDWINNNNGYNFHIEYTILPPSVNSFNVSEANHVHGDGSEGNPYIIPYGSDLSLTISGSQAHTDINSSAQYYNTSSADAWSTTATKTINVRSAEKTSVTVKMRYSHNTEEDLNGAESSETIWYKADANYTVTVEAGDHGSITVPTTGSVQVGNYAKATITATANSHYVFDGWECTDGVTVANSNSATTTVTATAAGTVRAKFAPVWAIKGSGTELGGWSTYNGLAYNSTTGKYVAEIPLAANTTYEFKVCDRGNSDNMYGYGATEEKKDYFSFIGQNSTCNVYRTDGGKDKNVRIFTAGAGVYTFEYQWSSDHGIIAVKYPTVTHPSSDYIYYYDYDNYASHGGLLVHMWKGAIYTGDDNMPYPSSFSFDGKTFYYAALGAAEEARFAGKDDVTLHKTENLVSASSNKGKYYDVTSGDSEAARWNDFTQTVTLNNQSASTAGATSVTATYGSAMPSIASNLPEKDGYNFQGYFASTDGSGTKYYNANGTSAHAWDQTGASPQIYAYWTPKTTTVSFNQTGGSGGQTSSVTATYDAAMPTLITTPTLDNYDFDGYWDGSGGTGNQYYNANGSSAATWNKEDATYTLHAKWDETPYTVTVVYKYGDLMLKSSTTIENVCVVTKKEAVATEINGYEFAGWTLVTGVTTADNLDDETIAINATADGKIITANYTPITCNGTVNGIDVSNGTYSVTFGESSLEVTSAPVKSGYHANGYYLTYDTELKNYSNPIAYSSETSTKDLVDEATVGPVTYTDDGNWVYYGGSATAPEIFVEWAANTITITLHRNDGSSTSTTTAVTMGGTDYTPAPSKLTRAGYTFNGYYTAPTGGVQVFDEDGETNSGASDYIGSYSSWIWPEDVDLYAQWTPVALSFVGGEGESGKAWNTASNWSPACVPTSGHDVTINAETTINGSAVAKSVTIGSSGKVTIQPTGVLEVAGTVTNTDADKLIINTDDSNQGALICDNSAGSTQATVNLTTQYADGKFQFIAIPLSGVSVASTFSGKGKYTYGWKYGEGWERRGYYDAFTAFEAVLLMGQTYTSFAGALVSTNDFSASLSYDESKVFGDVYMYGNSWTAPIRRPDMTLSGILSINILNGSSNGWDGVVSDDVIPALQGYAAVVGSSGGSISIDYDDAVRNAATPNASLRAPKRNVSDPIAVYVTSNEMQTRIRLFEDEQFTDELDEGYEALYMEGNGYAGELYAMGAKKMNVLATSDLEGTVVGFVPGQATEYTISFAGEGKGYYLNDIEAQESTLISEENTYTFLSGTNDAARFIVSRTPIQKTTTGADVIYDGVKARKQMINGTLYIIRDGRMYDATGALVK